MKTSISIMGTGWLGTPLAKSLLKENYNIKGSTTSEEKISELKLIGIDPYLIHIKENNVAGNITAFLNHSKILIINIPPGLRRNPESNFVAKIQGLIPYIEKSTIKKVLFVSSTSVFIDQDDFPVITSQTIPNAKSNAERQLIQTEHLLRENKNFQTTILRFGGLYDERRHPATTLSKRTHIKSPNAPVNLIHRKDCIEIIKKIIAVASWSEVYNAACPEHPAKAEYYTNICEEMGLPLPGYDFESVSVGKLIDSNKLISVLSYKFQVSL